jgi:hypothetical protein
MSSKDTTIPCPKPIAPFRMGALPNSPGFYGYIYRIHASKFSVIAVSTCQKTLNYKS